MSKRKNARTLSEIADAVHSLERTNIIDIGDLLIEAKEQGCEFGEWMDWLEAEFDWSVNTAERYMNVARLASKFPNLGNLNLGKTTLYALADDYEGEEMMPAIIEELAKHATKTRLKPCDAKRVIKIGIGRGRFGDHPDATLAALADFNLDEYNRDDCWSKRAVAALQEREPATDENASAIVDEIVEADHKERIAAQKAGDAEREAELAALLDDGAKAKDEAESLLDGAPPSLPPPTTPPEPQTLHADTSWAGRDSFVDAVQTLLGVCTKPAARFVGMFSPAELRVVADFLMAVAAADKKEAAAPPETNTNTVAVMPDIPACLDRRPTSTAPKTEADKAKAEALN